MRCEAESDEIAARERCQDHGKDLERERIDFGLHHHCLNDSGLVVFKGNSRTPNFISVFSHVYINEIRTCLETPRVH